jgi:hypothetical protein
MDASMVAVDEPEQILSGHLRAFEAGAAGVSPGVEDAAAAQEGYDEVHIAEALRQHTERLTLQDLDEAAFAQEPS